MRRSFDVRDTPSHTTEADTSVGVRGRRRRCRDALLLFDVRSFVVARTAIVGRATHEVAKAAFKGDLRYRTHEMVTLNF